MQISKLRKHLLLIRILRSYVLPDSSFTQSLGVFQKLGYF